MDGGVGGAVSGIVSLLTPASSGSEAGQRNTTGGTNLSAEGGFSAVLVAVASLGVPLHGAQGQRSPGLADLDHPELGDEPLPVLQDMTQEEVAPEGDEVGFAVIVQPVAVGRHEHGDVLPRTDEGRASDSPPRPTDLAGHTSSSAAATVEALGGSEVTTTVAKTASADTITLDPRLTRGLSRDFVSRLQRVADRMFNEYGHRVELLEGYRPQVRQNMLFEQGRSTPGPIVTWTRNSKHTQGLAADVKVNGEFITNPVANILARVAREEGLKTLYPFDSGHIEMDDGTAQVMESRAGRPTPERAGGGGYPAIARPARVAAVAAVAGVARPGNAAPRSASEDVPVPPTLPDPPSLRGVPAGAPGAVADAASIVDQGEVLQRTAEVSRAVESAVDLVATPTSGAGSSAAASVQAAAQGGVSLPLVSNGEHAPPTYSTPVVNFTDLSDQLTSQLQRIYLPLNGPEAGGALQLGIHGDRLDAVVSLRDATQVEQIERSLVELRQSLQKRGLEARHLSVRHVPDIGVEAVRPTVQSGESSGNRSPTSDGSLGRSNPEDRPDARRRDARERRQHQQEETP